MPDMGEQGVGSQALEEIRTGIAKLYSGIHEYRCMLGPQMPRPMRKKDMISFVERKRIKKPEEHASESFKKVFGDWDQVDIPFPESVPDKIDLPRPKHRPAEERDAFGSIKFREKVSPESCAQMVASTNRFWKALTGRDIHFIFYPEQQPYISPLEHTLVRNRILMSMCLKQPDILEIGVGAGSEFLSILFMMNPRSLIGLEPSDEDVAGKDAWKVAKQNLEHWYRAFPEYDWKSQIPHKLLQMTAADYFGKIKAGRYWAITLLDPPFKNGQNTTFEDDLNQSLVWVMKEVLEPMLRHGHKTSIFVLKSRYPPGQVSVEWQRLAEKNYHESDQHSAFMRDLVFYDSVGACPFQKQVDYNAIQAGQATRGVFYWVFFSRMEDRIHCIGNSALWTATVRRGETVYIPKSSFVNPDFTYDYSKYTGNHEFHRHMHAGDEEVQGAARPSKAPDNVTEEALDQAFAHASVHERTRQANPYASSGIPHQHDSSENPEVPWTQVRRTFRPFKRNPFSQHVVKRR